MKDTLHRTQLAFSFRHPDKMFRLIPSSREPQVLSHNCLRVSSCRFHPLQPLPSYPVDIIKRTRRQHSTRGGTLVTAMSCQNTKLSLLRRRSSALLPPRRGALSPPPARSLSPSVS